MNVRKLIQRRIRHRAAGVDVVGDINAVISANVGDGGSSSTHVSTRQRVVQRGGRTAAHETEGGDAHDGRRE